MALVNQRVTLENFEQARSLFTRALALDAGNVDAMVGLGRIDALEAAAYLVDDRAAHRAAAETILTEALSLAPNNAWAHFWLAQVLSATRRAPQALVEFDRALALNPESGGGVRGKVGCADFPRPLRGGRAPGERRLAPFAP